MYLYEYADAQLVGQILEIVYYRIHIQIFSSSWPDQHGLVDALLNYLSEKTLSDKPEKVDVINGRNNND